MSTKHKPGIVGIWMHMVFQEKLNSDTNHKLQSVCRKNILKKLKESNQQNERDKDHIINCKPPFLFTERNCRGVFSEAILHAKATFGRLKCAKPFCKGCDHQNLQTDTRSMNFIYPLSYSPEDFWMFLDEGFLLVILTALANLNSECHWQKTSPVAPGFPLSS